MKTIRAKISEHFSFILVKNQRPLTSFWNFLTFTSVVYENLLTAVKRFGYKKNFNSIISNPKYFFLSVCLYWPACRHDLKNNTHKKHKVSRHVQSKKMLIKSTKMFVDIFNIHTCKCKNIRVYFELLLCIAKLAFFTYLPMRLVKKLYTVLKLSPKLSEICIFSKL